MSLNIQFFIVLKKNLLWNSLHQIAALSSCINSPSFETFWMFSLILKRQGQTQVQNRPMRKIWQTKMWLRELGETKRLTESHLFMHGWCIRGDFAVLSLAGKSFHHWGARRWEESQFATETACSRSICKSNELLKWNGLFAWPLWILIGNYYRACYETRVTHLFFISVTFRQICMKPRRLIWFCPWESCPFLLSNRI